ncbi:hypothetical protein TW84_08350 [Vibrio neptunius]|uniref:DUF6630 family protein n=1 Tax=Vibrio neptunius TaxID=170651 RepID=UPI0005FA313D|nr:hypothetical protein [Vibrio neptunius]KJY91481.1 hypothetical protein TW84_08350 [Vibrio neptunius]
MVFIAKLFIAIVVLLTLAGSYILKEKKWLLSAIISPLPDDDKAKVLDFFEQSKSEHFDEKLLSTLGEVDESKYWLMFRIDWCDTDEVEAQANAMTKTYSIEDKFHINVSVEGASVWSLLVVYDRWLQERGYQVVLWEQGSDEYCGFICKSEVLRRFIRAGKLSGLKLMKLDHANEQ